MENKKAIPTPPIKRNSSIELLRIISMIMIVFHHFAVHGNFAWERASTSTVIPHLWHKLILTGGKIGVDIFILISGYFLVNSRNSISTNSRRVLKIWGQVFFYSITLYTIYTFAGRNTLGVKQTLTHAFMPITYNSWWFASTYFVLFLLHPFLNKLIHCLDRRQHQLLVLLLVVCWCIIPTFIGQDYQGNSLSWFITLYLIAGYARIYGFNPKFTCKHYWIAFCIISATTYVLSLGFSCLFRAGIGFTSFIPNLYGQNNLPVLLISLSLFMAFSTMKFRYHTWINVTASATFGVYLIHDYAFMRPYLWKEFFKVNQYQDTPMLIPYSIAVVAIIYVVCTLIDLFRQRVFERPYIMLVNRYTDTCLEITRNVNNCIKRIVFGK